MTLRPPWRSTAWSEGAELVEGARAHAAAAGILALSQALMLLPVALLVRHAFDVEVPRDDEAGIVLSGLLIALCYIASAALTAVGRGFAAKSAKVALSRTRRRLVSRLETLPLSWHDRRDAGALHAVVVQDCERVDRMVNSLMSQALPAAAALLALGVVAAVLNLVLFAVVVAFLPVMLAGSGRFARSYRTRLARWHAIAETFSEHTHVMLGGLATLRAAGAERRDRERFDEEIERFTVTGYEAAISGARYQAVQGATGALAGVAVLVVGGLLVAGRQLSLGGLFAFYAVVALMLRQLSTALIGAPLIVEGMAALVRVRELAHAEEAGRYIGEDSIEFTGAITLDGVSFSYCADRERAIEDVTLAIAPAEHVCLVGANGAGKTTLMALMLGLYRPQRGRVLADGVPLAELDLLGLRQQIGVILQDAELFAGTVRENLTLADPQASDAALAAALSTAAAGEFTARLPDGLATRLGDGGSGLSGGQRQRIAIARAVLCEPAMMLLDEPTTYLSPATARAVIDNLVRLPWLPTVVVITHDDTIAARADRVVRIARGQLVES